MNLLLSTLLTACLTAPPPSATCEGDLNGDNIVGTSDVLILLEAWGLTDEGDFTGNGTTGSADLLIILLNFGTYCQVKNG